MTESRSSDQYSGETAHIPFRKAVGHRGYVLRAIIGLNIGLYIISLLIYPIRFNIAQPLNAFAPGIEALLILGAAGAIPIDQYHMWWSLVTANYLHGSLLHIVFNMIALNQLGAMVSRMFGVSRFLIIYTVSGIIGFWVSYLANVRFTIGASAAICGLIGAVFIFAKTQEGLLRAVIYRQISGWMVGIILMGFVPNINNWGHGAGLISGVVVAFLLGGTHHRPEGKMDKALSLLCMAITVGSLGISLAVMILRRF